MASPVLLRTDPVAAQLQYVLESLGCSLCSGRLLHRIAFPVVSEVGLFLCPSPVARYAALGQDYYHKLAFSRLAAPPSVTSSWLPEQASVAEVLDGEHANELAPKPMRCL